MLLQLAQLGVSLAAILLLAWIARKLRLGEDVRIAGEEHARRLAEEAICGFAAKDLALDRAGIVCAAARHPWPGVPLRRHGAHFAARLLHSHAFARLDRNLLTIGTGEQTFGTITLDLGDQAQVWASSLRRLGN